MKGVMMRNKEHTEHIALFIDLDNFVGFCLGLGLPIDLSPEIERLTEMGKITIRRSFGDIYKVPLSDAQKVELRKMLQNNQIQHEDIPYQNNFKNSSDIRLAVETISTAFSNEKIDMFAIVAKDRDYLPLFAKLREMGKEIIGIAGNRDGTPDLYVKACDYFYYHEALTSNIPRPLEKDISISKQNIDIEEVGLMASTFSKDDAVNLLVDAMTSFNERGNSVMDGAPVIQMMRRLKPDFDLKTYGFNTFKELCQYAESAKTIVIKHDGVIFNLQLSDQAIKQNQPNDTAANNDKITVESSVDHLHKWFENKVRIKLPDLSQRKMIYEQLLKEEIYKGGISLNDLSKKVESKITKSKSTQDACFKILYSLYRGSCFSCIPGTTQYNPFVQGVNISIKDPTALDIRFIKSNMKVYMHEHKTNANPASWSELFFGSKDMEDIIKEIMRSL